MTLNFNEGSMVDFCFQIRNGKVAAFCLNEFLYGNTNVYQEDLSKDEVLKQGGRRQCEAAYRSGREKLQIVVVREV